MKGFERYSGWKYRVDARKGAVTKDDRLTFTPVLAVNLDSVFRCDGRHDLLFHVNVNQRSLLMKYPRYPRD